MSLHGLVTVSARSQRSRVDLDAADHLLARAARKRSPSTRSARQCLLHGVDELGYLLRHEGSITLYEAHSRRGGVVMNARIVLLPGDGVGPEVTGAARLVLGARRGNLEGIDSRSTSTPWAVPPSTGTAPPSPI